MTEKTDALLERIATALEQISLVLIGMEMQRQHPPAPSPAPQQPAQTFKPIGWTCPTHGTQKVIPAGVSSKTGKPYDAFVACGERGCNEKPPRVMAPVPERAIPPGIQAMP